VAFGGMTAPKVLFGPVDARRGSPRERGSSVPAKFSWRVDCLKIRIKLAGAVVRFAVGTDGALLTEVLRAVRAASA